MYCHIDLSSEKPINQVKHGEGCLTTNSLGTARLNSQGLQFALLKHDNDWTFTISSRKGKMDIIAEILLFCEEQKTKTSIMYNANLNYSQLKNHLNTLTSQGLLEKKTNKYVTTERGYRFLELFAQINDLLKRIQKAQINFNR